MLVGGLLEYVPRAAELDHLKEVRLAGLHGEDQHRQVRVRRLDPPQRLQPTEAGHANVQHHHVDRTLRGQCLDLLDGFLAITRRADDVQVRLRIDQQAQARAQHRVVVG